MTLPKWLSDKRTLYLAVLLFRSRSIPSSVRCRHGHSNAGLREAISSPSTLCFCLLSIFFATHEPSLTNKIVISTGKSDWERDITDDKDSLAAAIGEVVAGASQPKSPKPASTTISPKSTAAPPTTKGVRSVTGLFNTSDSTRTSVLNGSHKTVCHDDHHESVMVFPDFKVVTEVPRSVQGAHQLWESAIDPSIGRDGSYREKSTLKTWILPYACVILLCEYTSSIPGVISDDVWSLICFCPGSHKKRDNRCGIAAPKLEHGENIPTRSRSIFLTSSSF